jgi:hypothetical protein
MFKDVGTAVKMSPLDPRTDGRTGTRMREGFPDGAEGPTCLIEDEATYIYIALVLEGTQELHLWEGDRLSSGWPASHCFSIHRD